MNCRKCCGVRLSPIEDPPINPVPIVMEGPKFVSNPEAPREQPALTDDARAGTDAAKARILVSFLE